MSQTLGWKNVLIRQEQPIYDALKIIDEEALRIALVVDDRQRLLGTITDGDVRRGILSGVAFNAPVSEVMHKNPHTATVDISRAALLAKMKELDILSIPLLDENGVIVDLQQLKDVLRPERHDNPVFIMAGGFGTRLRPLTDDTPKPMLKVGDRPILETLILNFKKAGFHNFYISTHYLPEVIREYFGDGSQHGVEITYVHEEAPLGTGGALGLLPDELPDLPTLMINGDVLTNIDFHKVLQFHNQQNSAATMCVREYDYQIPYGVVEIDGNSVVSMVEKPVHHFYVNAGIYVVSRDLIHRVKKDHRIDMPTLLEQEIAAGRDVVRYPVHEYWLDIGQMDDFRRAQTDIMALGI